MTQMVIGGGIAGILAAILLKRKYPQREVILVEQEETCGGLLRSITLDSGDEFDYGTHIVGETANPALNEILFAGFDHERWHHIPMLKPGNYFAGSLYKYSQLLHLANLPDEELAELTYDFLNTERSSNLQPAHLEQYLQANYGVKITARVYQPLMKKLMGTELNQLHPDAHRLFGYERLILGSSHMMRELKQIPVFDALLAFKSYTEGVSSLSNYYPKNGKGIGLWVDTLVQQAQNLGVEILTATKISAIELKDKQIKSVTLDGETSYSIEQLIWTIPPFLLLRMTGLAFKSAYRPTQRGLSLHHFVIDKPFLTDNFHVYCNDPDMLSFRITLYSNITATPSENNGRYRCTVEVMTDDTSNPETIAEQVWQELKTMKVIASDCEAVNQQHQAISSGFPVYTNELVNEMQRQATYIRDHISNVQLLGKASTDSFFMNDVLVDVYNALN